MRLLRWLVRSGRALSALLLLATLVAGEVADARHHLSEHGCAADTAGRDDNCTCASLHASALASEPPVQLPPRLQQQMVLAAAPAAAPAATPRTAAVPRAPPTA